MTKVLIGSVLEFIPDEAEAKEAKLLDLIEDHMGKDMRAMIEEYISAQGRAEELEYESHKLKEQLREAEYTVDGLRESIEELKYKWR